MVSLFRVERIDRRYWMSSLTRKYIRISGRQAPPISPTNGPRRMIRTAAIFSQAHERLLRSTKISSSIMELFVLLRESRMVKPLGVRDVQGPVVGICSAVRQRKRLKLELDRWGPSASVEFSRRPRIAQQPGRTSLSVGWGCKHLPYPHGVGEAGISERLSTCRRSSLL